MATIYVDDKPYEVDENQNLLHVCLSLGLDIPYFCWHPALGSIGACRQCAVKQFRDQDDKRGKIVMACMTPAKDGTRISIDDPDAKAFRKAVAEWLMLNHPHDCPVCDEGGECHLQDMTIMDGHKYRRARYRKRTFQSQNLGPFIHHEMNRCIQCYRCVRFYRDYAGGRDLQVFGAHDNLFFGRQNPGPLENEFSGNLVEVCPTGVFTDKTFRQHYTRPWDLESAPSVCVHCAVGCNTIPGARYGRLRRIRNRYNAEVNSYFLCDRGRFGYSFANTGARMRIPLGRGESGQQHPLSPDEALEQVKQAFDKSDRVIGIGSPRASLEANFALRTLVGEDNFYLGVSPGQHELVALGLDLLRKGKAATPSLRDLEKADAMLILGEDITNTAPLQALLVRHWLRRRPEAIEEQLDVPNWNDAAISLIMHQIPSPLFLVAPHPTKLEDVAAEHVCAAPDDIASLGLAVAAAIDDNARRVEGLRPELSRWAEQIAERLRKAKRPVILSGTGAGSVAIMRAAAAVAWALASRCEKSQLYLAVPECNSYGLCLIGGKPLSEAFDAVKNGRAVTVVILENDLYRREDKDNVDAFLHSCRHTIMLDHIMHATAREAGLTLPCSTVFESEGTLVNIEGRAQRYYKVLRPEGAVQASWRWLRDIGVATNNEKVAQWRRFDDVAAAMCAQCEGVARVAGVTPSADFRELGRKIPRETLRYSGRTAIHAAENIHEPQPPEDPDSPLAFSMEGFPAHAPSGLLPHFWSPGYNSPQAVNKFQKEIAGVLRGGDSGVRLFEPSRSECPDLLEEAPQPFEPREGEWFMVPAHNIFGSDELSMLSPSIAERASDPWIALNESAVKRLGLGAGGIANVQIGNRVVELMLRVDPRLPEGIAVVLSDHPQLPLPCLPAWGKIAPGEPP